MVKQKPLTNRQLLIQALTEIDGIWEAFDRLADKIEKIDFATSVINLSEGKSNITIISPEPLKDDPNDGMV